MLSERLRLITTPSALRVADALTSARTDERDTGLAMIHLNPPSMIAAARD